MSEESISPSWKAKKLKKDIIEFFPYSLARDEQRDVLKAIEKHWDAYDV
jgi:hypothetical protein